jgi:hypothetical protein
MKIQQTLSLIAAGLVSLVASAEDVETGLSRTSGLNECHQIIRKKEGPLGYTALEVLRTKGYERNTLVESRPLGTSRIIIDEGEGCDGKADTIFLSNPDFTKIKRILRRSKDHNVAKREFYEADELLKVTRREFAYYLSPKDQGPQN